MDEFIGRKVSLSDTARKRRMELRLIHSIGYGEPWFGRWGYQFGRGSYGVTQQTYHKAIQALRAIPLLMLTSILPEVSAILPRYQTMSGHSLQTLGHLFHYILELRRRIPLHSLTSTDPPHHGIMADSNNCRWSSKRVEMAIWVIVEALKKAGFRWVSRQEVRDAARLYVGDTGLLDFVLKSLGNHVVGNYVVRRAVNPVTKVLEYCLEDVSSTAAIFPRQSLPVPVAVAAEDPKTNIPPPRLHVTRAQLMKDIYCLYKHVLMMEQRFTVGVLEAIPAAVRIVLDVKRLIKDYGGEMLLAGKNAGEELMEIMCTISLRQRDHHDVDSSSPPYELIVLPNRGTVGDLKREVELCFREMYWCLRSFTAESVVGMDGRRDGDLLYGLLEAGASVVVRGRSGLEEDVGSGRSCEGGNIATVWMMDCPCGAKEDDGERMISCDICEVWQHTRCVGVSDEFPQQIFLCSQCEQKIVIVPPLL